VEDIVEDIVGAKIHFHWPIHKNIMRLLNMSKITELPFCPPL
jgi:hypothetical protein